MTEPKGKKKSYGAAENRKTPMPTEAEKQAALVTSNQLKATLELVKQARTGPPQGGNYAQRKAAAARQKKATLATRLSTAELAVIHAYRDQGFSKAEVARLTGRHYNTICNVWDGVGKEPTDDGIISESKLSAEARRAKDDFAYFRARYFGRVTRPWHVQAATRIVSLLESANDEYVVINCPPGCGKTTLLNDIVCWVLVRDRAKRILMGSGAQNTAADNTNRVMNDLVRPDPWKATRRNLALGLETDGDSTLTDDYGRFKPDNGARWTKEKFFVAQDDGRTVQEKEPSVVAFGRDSTFLGGRFDLCIWDDLVTEKTNRGEDARDKLIRFWSDIAETRTEPGGLHVLCGQRLYADDLYRYCLDLPAGVEDGTDGQDYPRKYHHIKFQAHDDENCTGLHDLDSPAQGEGGCLLDPVRLPWRKLQMLKANPLSNYETVYQQNDGDPTSVLVQQVWIDGGRGKDGIEYVGCLDRSRSRWQIPQGLTGFWSYLTVDPSPAKFWSIQAWLFHRETEHFFLLDMIRDRIDYPDWLREDNGTFHGIAQEWAMRAKELGVPFQHVIFERNAAQKFVIPQMAKWGSRHNLNVVGHDTHAANKNHTDYGVQGLAPLYLHGKVRLPYATPDDQRTVRPLIREVTTWPGGATDDCVMSQWFGVYNQPRLAGVQAQVILFPRPSWMRSA